MTNRTDAQAAINALTAKQGVSNSVTPTNLSTEQLQVMLDSSAMIDELPPTGYCDFSVNPTLTLTTTPTVVTGWVENEVAPAVGISESGGEFTVTTDGIWRSSLERVYENGDNNPALLVTVTIAIEEDTGGGYVELWTRTAPLMSATANDEPAILSFTTPSNRVVLAGTKLRILVSGQDGGGNPADARFIRAKFVANIMSKTP